MGTINLNDPYGTTGNTAGNLLSGTPSNGPAQAPTDNFSSGYNPYQNLNSQYTGAAMNGPVGGNPYSSNGPISSQGIASTPSYLNYQYDPNAPQSQASSTTSPSPPATPQVQSSSPGQPVSGLGAAPGTTPDGTVSADGKYVYSAALGWRPYSTPQAQSGGYSTGYPTNLSGANLPNTPLGMTTTQVPGTVTQQTLPTIGQTMQNQLQSQANMSPQALADQAKSVAQSFATAPWLMNQLGGNPNLSDTQNTAALYAGMNPTAGVNPANYNGPVTAANAPLNVLLGGAMPSTNQLLPDWTSPTNPANPVSNPLVAPSSGAQGPAGMVQSNSPLGYTYNSTPNSNNVVTTPLGYTQYAGQPQTQSNSSGNDALFAALMQLIYGNSNNPTYGLLSGSLGGL